MQGVLGKKMFKGHKKKGGEEDVFLWYWPGRLGRKRLQWYACIHRCLWLTLKEQMMNNFKWVYHVPGLKIIVAKIKRNIRF